MRKRTKEITKLSLKKQVREHAESKQEAKQDVTFDKVISTGSTLLDLSISGGAVRGGGIPPGIMVVGYGPSGAGKTVLACEIAGAIQRQGGELMYRDSEARLNPKFAELFDMDYDSIDYTQPNTISEAFTDLHKWKPDPSNINGYVVDSLAALSTSMEMDNDEGDKMGMRRAKEFSEHLRKGARNIKSKNMILFCTNQIRENADAKTPYSRKDVNPGGKAIEFYSSLILRFTSFSKIKEKIAVKGKDVTRVVGIEGIIEVDKSSIWKPYRQAPITIYFDYGIDDIRENLKFLKQYTGATSYVLGGENIGKSLEQAIKHIEQNKAEKKLKEEVTDLWEEIEKKFDSNRKKKRR